MRQYNPLSSPAMGSANDVEIELQRENYLVVRFKEISRSILLNVL